MGELPEDVRQNVIRILQEFGEGIAEWNQTISEGACELVLDDILNAISGNEKEGE